MSVTRLPNGLNTFVNTQGLADVPFPVPTDVAVYFEDFFFYTANDWDISGSGTNTIEIIDDDCGILGITLATTGTPAVFLYKDGECFSFINTERREVWFEIHAAIGGGSGNFTDTQMVFGLADTAGNNGVYFNKNEATADFRFVVEENNVDVLVEGIYTLDTEDLVRYSFYFDGDQTLSYYINDQKVGSVDNTNIPFDAPLTPFFIMREASGASDPAREMRVDYFIAAQNKRGA